MRTSSSGSLLSAPVYSCLLREGLALRCCHGTVPKMEWEGVWASQYPSNDGKDGRVDLIRLDKDRTGKIIATKLTGTRLPRMLGSWRYSRHTRGHVASAGNRFVPAGKVSFEAILHKNGMMGRGRALLACDGFVDPRWVAGEFHADSADTFSFHWCASRWQHVVCACLCATTCPRVCMHYVHKSRHAFWDQD